MSRQREAKAWSLLRGQIEVHRDHELTAPMTLPRVCRGHRHARSSLRRIPLLSYTGIDETKPISDRLE
jgi:hypothetical protein